MEFRRVLFRSIDLGFRRSRSSRQGRQNGRDGRAGQEMSHDVSSAWARFLSCACARGTLPSDQTRPEIFTRRSEGEIKPDADGARSQRRIIIAVQVEGRSQRKAVSVAVEQIGQGKRPLHGAARQARGKGGVDIIALGAAQSRDRTSAWMGKRWKE